MLRTQCEKQRKPWWYTSTAHQQPKHGCVIISNLATDTEHCTVGGSPFRPHRGRSQAAEDTVEASGHWAPPWGWGRGQAYGWNWPGEAITGHGRAVGSWRLALLQPHCLTALGVDMESWLSWTVRAGGALRALIINFKVWPYIQLWILNLCGCWKLLISCFVPIQ